LRNSTGIKGICLFALLLRSPASALLVKNLKLHRNIKFTYTASLRNRRDKGILTVTSLQNCLLRKATIYLN
jgi:hypothetical protein